MLASRIVTVQENHNVDDLDEAIMVLRFSMQTTPFIPNSIHIHIQPIINMGIPQYAMAIAGLVRSEGDVPEPSDLQLIEGLDDDDTE